MNKTYQEQIEKVKMAIDKDVKNNCVVEDLHKGTDLSERLFRDMYRSMYGLSPKQYINDVQYKRLLKLMKNDKKGSPFNAYELAQELGLMHSTSLYGFIKRNLWESKSKGLNVIE